MCGFAGLWRPTAAPAQELERDARAMAEAIVHRGPDDAGVWCDPAAGLALAHRRLSILDLSPAGHQPMASASGRYRIAFNGEIYNHLALRRELEATGALQQPWRGHSDTETLLAAIEAWGLEVTLRRCVGMFALALWDQRAHLLHLARDRFGEKPLYWGSLQAGGQRVLAFASELAALRALPGAESPAVNPAALAAFFRLGCIPAPLCIQAGLQQLPPGHWLTIPSNPEGGAPPRLPEPTPWWDLQAEASADSAERFASESEALAALEDALLQSVAGQSLADVPLGAFLSGGIDSSLITALLQAQSSRPVRSFTIAFPDAGGGESGFNEAPYARAVADHLGTDHTEVALTAADARGLIPQLPRLYSEPFADSSQLPTHLVCREARRSGLTVALSGDGGDELFGGYNRHRLAPALHQRFGRLPPLVRRALARSLEHLPVSSGGLARDKRRKLAAALRASGSLETLHAALTSLWADPAGLLQPHWLAASSSHSLTAADLTAALPSAPSSAEQLMLADVRTYLPADILVKVDRAAMAASLETRAPFLDHRVAAVAWRLPLAMKIRPGGGPAASKWALRQLLYRHVPPALIERPKAGFAMPIGAWLRGPLRSWAEDLLDPQLLVRQGYLRSEPIGRLWRAHQSGADHTTQLWAVLMWQAWLAEWGIPIR
jgi:asparagine synthase (glutamine-hydrolysing)